jgi:hypothetical protein
MAASFIACPFGEYRSNDETMKLWDIRSFKRYVNMADGLFSRFDQTDCSFSPDNKMVITGSCPPRLTYFSTLTPQLNKKYILLKRIFGK